jgi:uncharacterized repeat protein (TIGR01451 family)
MTLGFNPQTLFGNLISARPRHSKGRATRGPIALGFESLEPRQMLAADMAEIIGTIRLDAQNDGNAANDLLVQGAQVRLYRDGGDGVFNNGAGDDVAALPATTSNSLGQYRFSGIGVGRYFVKIDLPAGMQTAAGGDVRTVTITAPDAAGAIGRTIDEFDSLQKVEASPPPNSAGVGSTKEDSTVLGGERDFRVEITGGTDEFSEVSLISARGLLRLASGAMVTGNATVVWDGADGDADAIDYTGLGGIDFTHDGPNTMTGIRLSVGADHPNAVVKLRIYSDASHWSEFTTTVPESAGGVIDKQAVFDFAIPTSSGGGGADFTKVGAIELTFVGVSAVDAQISVAELVGLTTKTADFTAFSELSVGDRVWLDENNNGQLDGGELGISGVKVNLYADMDGNNQFSPGVDAFVATATTNASGQYLFGDLMPGSYVVQVDAANFQTGAALDGLQSSNASAPADPDGNLDNDDNGAALAGHGVVSLAVSLLGGAEPTSDGDDANSNRTVDFGFFGFDLVLDKSVDLHSASPLQPITYSVLVINDGPAIAKNVQFKDTLPSGVTFQSYTVSKGGVTLTHNGGQVTGGLGDMAPGAQIIITIQAEVNAGATGILINDAEVSAVDEVYLLNNKDRVETPVTPKIDLAIGKSDSDDPVEPGAQFSYSLLVTNNGPSNATGVRVIDDLPSQVTFVSASRPNSSTLPGQLEFNVGNLAAGASTTITVVVQVNAGFVGTLVNDTEVVANETETDYTNNIDSEPTIVRANPASIGGHVYNDKDNDGVFDAAEKPIANVVITLTGNDLTGAFISRTTTTDAAGKYQFDNLMPGTYIVFQPAQPPKFKDGLDTLGNTFNGAGVMQAPNGLVAPDQNADDQRDSEAFEGIVLKSGFAAKDYNFGELAVTTNKRDFVRPLVWR